MSVQGGRGRHPPLVRTAPRIVHFTGESAAVRDPIEVWVGAADRAGPRQGLGVWARVEGVVAAESRRPGAAGESSEIQKCERSIESERGQVGSTVGPVDDSCRLRDLGECAARAAGSVPDAVVGVVPRGLG